MTLPSGTISLSQVNTELDISPSSTTINMGATAVRTLAEQPSGAIAMSDLQGQSNAQFVTATGGTIATSGDFKIHTFNSSGTFSVSQAGNAAGSTTVEYLIVAGGGSGGSGYGGAGGAGGFRINFPQPATGGTSVSAQNYPISIGAGASGSSPPGYYKGNNGNPSSAFSVTSTAGGLGAGVDNTPDIKNGGPGGSGGGKSQPGGTVGAGNTPPVSPPQGNPGGQGNVQGNQGAGGGGGGANASGGNGRAGPSGPGAGGTGGAGTSTNISGSSVAYAGGGGGGYWAHYSQGSSAPGGTGGGGATGAAGTANRGGGSGGGAVSNIGGRSGSGGSGVVIVRYKFQ